MPVLARGDAEVVVALVDGGLGCAHDEGLSAAVQAGLGAGRAATEMARSPARCTAWVASQGRASKPATRTWAAGPPEEAASLPPPETTSGRATAAEAREEPPEAFGEARRSLRPWNGSARARSSGGTRRGRPHRSRRWQNSAPIVVCAFLDGSGVGEGGQEGGLLVWCCRRPEAPRPRSAVGTPGARGGPDHRSPRPPRPPRKGRGGPAQRRRSWPPPRPE